MKDTKISTIVAWGSLFYLFIGFIFLMYQPSTYTLKMIGICVIIFSIIQFVFVIGKKNSDFSKITQKILMIINFVPAIIIEFLSYFTF